MRAVAAPPVDSAGWAARWADVLGEYRRAIEHFWSEIREPAKGVAPVRSRAVESYLRSSADEISRLRAFADSGVALSTLEGFRRLLDSADAGEDARRRLAAAEVIATDPSLVTLATSRMSRSYSEELGVKRRAVKLSGSAVSSAEQGFTLHTAKSISGDASGLSVENIKSAFVSAAGSTTGTRGGVSTDIYLTLLSAHAGGGDAQAGDARALLESAKDMVLGYAGQKSRAPVPPLHPIQALGIVCAPAVQTELPPDSEAVDFSLPKSSTCVIYNPMPLIDAQAALKFGPVALTTSGLNYTIIQRFQTISERPIRRRQASALRLISALPERQDGALPVTLDAGETGALISPARVARWSPAEGPKPRVVLYGEACGAVVRNIVGDAVQRGDTMMKDLMAGQASLDAKFALAKETVSKSLIVSFTRAYDTTFASKPPESSTEVSDLLGQTPSFLLAGLMGASRVKDMVIAASHLLSDPRVPQAITGREAWVSALTLANESASEIRKKMRAAYWARPLAIPGGESPSKVRADVLDHFERVIIPAALSSDNIPVLKATAKIFAMLESRSQS